MNLNQIENGDPGSTVRTKLNENFGLLDTANGSLVRFYPSRSQAVAQIRADNPDTSRPSALVVEGEFLVVRRFNALRDPLFPADPERPWGIENTVELTDRPVAARGSLLTAVGEVDYPFLQFTLDRQMVAFIHPETLTWAFTRGQPLSRGSSLVLVRDGNDDPLVWVHPVRGVESAMDYWYPKSGTGGGGPNPSPSGPSTGHSGVNGTWPNVDSFDLTVDGPRIDYSSPQFRGETRRFSVRPDLGPTSIARTNGKHMGIFYVGQAWGNMDNPLESETWPFHVLGISGPNPVPPPNGQILPLTVAKAILEKRWSTRAALNSYQGVSRGVSSTAAGLSAALGPYIRDRTVNLASAADKYALGDPVVRMVIFNPGGGDPTGDPATIAADLNSAVATIRSDIQAITGQTEAIQVPLIQYSGTRTDGTYASTLGQAALFRNHTNNEVWPVTAEYAYPLAPGQNRPSDESLQAIAGLLSEFHDARLANQPFHAPVMSSGILVGTTLEITFLTLGNLVLDPNRQTQLGDSGFRVTSGNNAEITQIGASGNKVVITLDKVPTGPITVSYAYGMTNPAGDWTANRGALRDDWSAPNPINPDQTLHRWALSDRITIA